MPLAPLLGIVAVAMIVALFYVVARTLTPDDSAPQSASYRAYRRTMRKHLKVAFIVPIAAAIVLTVYGIVAQTLDPTNPTATPAPIRLALGLLWSPGFYLLPLIAMLLTEMTTRPSGPRVATLAPRGVRELFPRWLLVAFGSVFAVAALTPLILTTPLGTAQTLESRSNPPTVEYSVNAAGIWIDYAAFVITGVLAVWVILAATRRPDIDPLTGSDSWGRSGTAVRALCLLYIPAVFVIMDGLEIPRNAALDYLDHVRVGGEPIDGWPTWLASTAPSYIADAISVLLMLGIVVALVVFARPPVPTALSAAASSAQRESDDEATAL
ncbi:hypothetical protein TPB0596_41150 [Tsukamurella pulmonis]|uniref:hypothetical protein n=1 Tax=Tsukamurella pulmonis TaxID=47312 RepID=UPI001EDD07BC|nr:hypothetical protein [Tsukamurella pulmonis]BDD84352.1 hypothetical protein TPB0596_41150 [Tsukamurella pulmonis]